MYKLETHLHTPLRSPCAHVDEATVASIYNKSGYNGIVITNHFNRFVADTRYPGDTEAERVRFYVDGYYELKNQCKKYGIDVFFGLELLLDELTYYKQDPPKAEMLIYGMDEQWLLDNGYRLFELSLPELSELCKQQGWLLSHAHPFRTTIDTQDPKYYEACETINGSPNCNNNELAIEFTKKQNLIPMCGSDFHNLGYDGSGIYLQNAVHTNSELVAEIRKRTHKLFTNNSVIEP